MRPFASVVCGVILTDEQVAALKKANGGTLPDDVLFGAGEPGNERLLVGTCLSFTDKPGFDEIATDDLDTFKTEAHESIADFDASWGHALKVDPNKIGLYLGLELLPERKTETSGG